MSSKIPIKSFWLYDIEVSKKDLYIYEKILY